MKYLLLILAILGTSKAQEYEYIYEDENTDPDTVLGYLMKEAVSQFQTEAQKVASKEELEVDKNEVDNSSIFDALKEKIFEIESSGNEDPVYNFIMVFSAIALFFQAFYTPFGKVSISGRKKRFTEEQAAAIG